MFLYLGQDFSFNSELLQALQHHGGITHPTTLLSVLCSPAAHPHLYSQTLMISPALAPQCRGKAPCSHCYTSKQRSARGTMKVPSLGNWSWTP